MLVNSSMARQGSLFSLLHFLIMYKYFICFTADSAIPLEFGISGELGFHLNPYLWASSLIIWLSNSGPPSLKISSGISYFMKCFLISLTVQPGTGLVISVSLLFFAEYLLHCLEFVPHSRPEDCIKGASHVAINC